jgi:hypothetical protein
MSARRLHLVAATGDADPLLHTHRDRRFTVVADPRKHPDWRPGLRELPTGRLVYDTGKVNIGEHAGQPIAAPRELDWRHRLEPMSADAEWLQQLLAARGQATDRTQELGHRIVTAVGAIALVGFAIVVLLGSTR